MAIPWHTVPFLQRGNHRYGELCWYYLNHAIQKKMLICFNKGRSYSLKKQSDIILE